MGDWFVYRKVGCVWPNEKNIRLNWSLCVINISINLQPSKITKKNGKKNK